MLSRHFRAHNLNVLEMRLLFSLRCADPGIFVRGGEGGRPDCRKTTATTLFLIFNPQLILQFCRGSSIFQGGSTFLRGWGGGGGGPDAYFHKNAYNLWFSRGVRAPCPPSGSAHVWEVSTSIPESLSLPLDVHKSVQNPRHCNSRLVKVSRVPVIATRGQ